MLRWRDYSSGLLRKVCRYPCISALGFLGFPFPRSTRLTTPPIFPVFSHPVILSCHRVIRTVCTFFTAYYDTVTTGGRACGGRRVVGFMLRLAFGLLIS